VVSGVAGGLTGLLEAYLGCCCAQGVIGSLREVAGNLGGVAGGLLGVVTNASNLRIELLTFFLCR
jgi:hypothetical protein